MGVDEAGRGPVIGPMVVGAVAVPPGDIGLLRALGIRDSKKLTPRRREVLAKEIKNRWLHALVVVPAEEIDRLREKKGLNEIEAEFFSQAIEKIAGQVPVEKVYVDAADTRESFFGREISRIVNMEKLAVVSEHRADEIYPVVSAASIIAKVERDRIVREIERDLGVSVGSGYPADPRTREFLKKWVFTHGTLPPHTRRSWDTVKKILAEVERERGRGVRRIDEY